MCVPVHMQYPVNSLQANTLTGPLTFPFIFQKKRPVTECFGQRLLKGALPCWKSNNKISQRLKAAPKLGSEKRSSETRLNCTHESCNAISLNYTAPGQPVITFYSRTPDVLERLYTVSAIYNALFHTKSIITEGENERVFNSLCNIQDAKTSKY